MTDLGQNYSVFIDPGPQRCGVVQNLDDGTVIPLMVECEDVGVLVAYAAFLAVEQVTGYGVPLSKAIRDQLLWMGEWRAIAKQCSVETVWVDYPEIMRRLFGTQRAKVETAGPDEKSTRAWRDTEIRERLLGLYGGDYKRRKRGARFVLDGEGRLRGMPWAAGAHEWSALAVGWAAENP